MPAIKALRRYVRMQLNIVREEEEHETYDEIKQGVNFKGYNLWILGFAMIIACVGLTTNSMSAVIGAMLISPLMGPIIGFAFGLAINDRLLRIKAIKNWVWMTGVSLLSATIFFLINPFDKSTEMLEAFKKASIFDIFLAFFGGLAGFIGIVKKEGVKIIAGVAIATACMPPLCTAAYGIAHLDYSFLAGGLYFYFINCLFIGWATYLLARYIKFSSLTVSRMSSFKIVLWDLLIVVMLVPGVYIGYQKWKIEEQKPVTLTDKQRIELLEKKVALMEAASK